MDLFTAYFNIVLHSLNHPPRPNIWHFCLSGQKIRFLLHLFDKLAYGAISAALNCGGLPGFNVPGRGRVTAAASAAASGALQDDPGVGPQPRNAVRLRQEMKTSLLKPRRHMPGL